MFTIKYRKKLSNKNLCIWPISCNNKSADCRLNEKLKSTWDQPRSWRHWRARISGYCKCRKRPHFFCFRHRGHWESKRSKPENFHFTRWGHRRSLNIPRRDASLSYMATLLRLEKSSRASESAKRDRVLTIFT